MKRPAGIVMRGVVAGILGASALAFWFLVVDASLGVPFRTPAFLSSALRGTPQVEFSTGLILLYTALHYAAFMVVGVVVTWVMSKLPVAPSVLLGLVLGFLLFDVVFYTSVYVTGVDVIEALGWPEVLVGNLIAGVTIMGFLHITGVARPVTWWQALAAHQTLREGIVAGLVGAGVVAVWFLLFDLVQGRPFFTPGALGSALFLGASDLAAVSVDWGTVTGYTVIHVAAFIGTGLLAAVVVTHAEETPPLLVGAILLFVAFEAFFMGFLAMIAEFLLGALAWWTIAVGNLLATVAMGYYLWVQHPRLREVLAEDPLDKTD